MTNDAEKIMKRLASEYDRLGHPKTVAFERLKSKALADAEDGPKERRSKAIAAIDELKGLGYVRERCLVEDELTPLGVQWVRRHLGM